jgi:hypothetical protein
MIDNPIEEATLKDHVRAKEIVQRIINHQTYTQIAEAMNLSRPALYATMNKQQVQQLMILEVTELETKLQQWITELHESKSPANQRTATQELAKMVKHVQDKLYPSIFRTETINLNLDLTPYHQQQQIHTETLNRLPPTHRPYTLKQKPYKIITLT